MLRPENDISRVIPEVADLNKTEESTEKYK